MSTLHRRIVSGFTLSFHPRLEGHIARLQRHTEELRNSLEGTQRTREARYVHRVWKSVTTVHWTQKII